jgi:NAD(P)-dependent dehydrogenase (short-subunit alcohol dehydrogenase family)
MKSIAELSSLKNRVAVVTGGAGKIGEAFCETLAELGATVCVLDINEAAAIELSRRLKEKFEIDSEGFAANLASEPEAERAIAAIGKRFGRLDILVNNAAYPPGELPPDGREIEKQTLAQWHANLEVMLTGTFLMVRAAVPWLKRSGRGAITITGSIYGLVGPDLRLYDGTEMGNSAYYAASKGGLAQLTRYWATTLAPEIRVNCIVPGGVARSQPQSFVERYEFRTPLKRMATEEDLKGAMAYLATDLSAYVTGQVVAVDGGWTAW